MGEDAQQGVTAMQCERPTEAHDLVELAIRESERERFLGCCVATAVMRNSGSSERSCDTIWSKTASSRLRSKLCDRTHPRKRCPFRKSYPHILMMQSGKIGMARRTPVVPKNHTRDRNSPIKAHQINLQRTGASISRFAVAVSRFGFAVGTA
jgi:hypothetical protein